MQKICWVLLSYLWDSFGIYAALGILRQIVLMKIIWTNMDIRIKAMFSKGCFFKPGLALDASPLF